MTSGFSSDGQVFGYTLRNPVSNSCLTRMRSVARPATSASREIRAFTITQFASKAHQALLCQPGRNTYLVWDISLDQPHASLHNCNVVPGAEPWLLDDSFIWCTTEACVNRAGIRYDKAFFQRPHQPVVLQNFNALT